MVEMVIFLCIWTHRLKWYFGSEWVCELCFCKMWEHFYTLGVFVWSNSHFWPQGRDRKLGQGPGGQKIHFFSSFRIESFWARKKNKKFEKNFLPFIDTPWPRLRKFLWIFRIFRIFSNFRFLWFHQFPMLIWVDEWLANHVCCTVSPAFSWIRRDTWKNFFWKLFWFIFQLNRKRYSSNINTKTQTLRWKESNFP